MVQNLIHFGVSQGTSIEFLSGVVVGKEDILPVLDEIFFGWIFDDFWRSSVFLEDFNDICLKCEFAIVNFGHRSKTIR